MRDTAAPCSVALHHIAGSRATEESATITASYANALKEGKAKGAGVCSDSEALALFLESSIQILCGAVSPKLVWEGAMKKGLTLREVGVLANSNPRAIEDLMWV